jgi:beta-lactamase regulating signal transducer with metallopeptidase domain/uncharacterized GH25 family protein
MNYTLSLVENSARGLLNASWQAAVLIVLVAAATWLLRRSRPMVRYALWSVVLIRLCLPFGFTSPLGVGSPARSLQRSSPPVPVVKSAAVVEFGPSEEIRARAEPPRASESVVRMQSHVVVSAPSAVARLSVWAWCGIVWMMGVVALSGFVLRRWSRLRRVVAGSEPCRRPELIALLDDLRSRLGVARAVGLKCLPAHADTLGPCAAGWLRPDILLPARLSETWELPMIEPILIHELAHIRRADVVINAAQVLVQIVYWFHPLVWLANARLRRERELICDDFAVLHSGATSRRYGATILRALEEVRLEPGWSLAGVGMGESGLAQRLRRLLDRGYALPRPVSRGAIGALILAGTVGVLIASDASPKKSADPVVPKSEPSAATPPAAVKAARSKPDTMITKEWKVPEDMIPVPVPADGEAAKNWLIAKGVVFNGEASAKIYLHNSRLIVRNIQDQIDLVDVILSSKLESGITDEKNAKELTPADRTLLTDFLGTPPEEPNDPRAIAVSPAPKGEFSGRVVDRDGKPVAGALVDAWDWCPGDETHTAADGTFRLTKLDPKNRIEVRFIKEGFAPYTIIKQPLGALQTPVVLDDQTYFEGVVTAPDGKPVPNASIRANQGPRDADGVSITTIWTETKSDAQGRYKLLLQDDTYDLQVTSPDAFVGRWPKLTIGPKQAVARDLRLEPGVVFRARLVDSQTGKPVAGVLVKDWRHPGVAATSDAQGNLSIAGLIPGPFEFQVKVKGYARWWSEECAWDSSRRQVKEGELQRNFDDLHYELSPGMEPVTITVEKAVRIRGRVVDPSGNPVASATAAPVSSLSGDTRFSVKTATDGSFEMFLPAGNGQEYNLMAHDGAYQEWRNWANDVAEPLRTKPGEEIEGVVLKLSGPGTVRGRVVDAAGNPAANLEVRAKPADHVENRYYFPTAHTDAEGRFEIKFIHPGKNAIQATPFEERGGATRTVNVAEGLTIEIPDLILPRPDRFAGGPALIPGKTDGTAAAAQAERTIIPKFEFQDGSVSEALKVIAAATGLKVICTAEVAEAAAQAKITLSLTNIPASEAFTYVTSLANLRFSYEEDGVHVTE